MSIFRKIKDKIVDDLIPNELKSPSGAAKAAATAYGLYSLGGGKYGIPGVGTDKSGFEFGKIIPRIGELGSAAAEKVGNVLQRPITDYLPGLAGGGIAKIAGVDSGPPPESGPNSQGLQGLMKRVRNL